VAKHISVDISHLGEPPAAPAVAGRSRNSCPVCGSHYREEEMVANLRVCTHCGHHFTVGARERVAQLVDPGSWTELDPDLHSDDPLGFVDSKPYPERIAAAERTTGLMDGLVTGTGSLGGQELVLAVMDFTFMGGSMGSVVGEKFARAADVAVARRLPMVSVASSGGARMQEGVLALMQMAKTVAAVDELRESGRPYVSVLAHPTTGGVAASFAALGDVIIAEPRALLSFTGPRVVKQTTGETPPADFGLAESNFSHGHIDLVIPRPELRDTVARVVALLQGGRPYRPPAPVATAGALQRLSGGVRRRVRGLLRRDDAK
jgi:acetyl-CoA carboxylase carboxyl transferase subunit beta